MKRTFRKILRREIRHGISRFLAIFAIVALGVGFLAGLLATTPAMRRSVDRYYDESHFMDLRVISTLGLTEESIESLRQIDGVEAVMPGYFTDLLLETPASDTTVARLHSVPLDQLGTDDNTYQNRLELREGRYPEAPGECVVQLRTMSTASNLELGDTLRLSPDSDDLSDTLAVTEFTVVGFVDSSYYFSIDDESTTVGSGTVEHILYTGENSFVPGVYQNAFLTVAGAAELDTFEEEYDARILPVQQAVEEAGVSIGQARLEEVRAEAEATLQESRQEFEEEKASALQQLGDARQELDDAIAQYQDGLAQWEQGRQELEDGEQELASQRAAYEEQAAAAREQLDASRAQLDEGQAQLDLLKQQLDEAEPQVTALRQMITSLREQGLTDQADALEAQYRDELAAYDQGMALYTSQAAALQAGEQEWQAGMDALTQGEQTAQQEFAQAEQELAEARQTLEETQAQLQDAAAQIESGEADYAAAKAEADEKLQDGQQQLDDAQAEIEAIAAPTWYVFTRDDNLAYSSFDSNADKVAAIAQVFPVFFFLVAALVALTTMTRMVEEQRTQIGTLKALGFSGAAIAAHYLLYAATATLGGCVCGLLVGFRLFPTVIWNAYGIMYRLPTLILGFEWPYALVSSIGALVCVLAAALGACWASLRSNAAQLMRPRAPKAGKRVFLEYITPLWSRLKFTQKVTARNLIRYKKRFFMTVFGIAGCTALLVTGFGLRDSISDIVDKQFYELYRYDTMVVVSDDAGDGVQEILNDPEQISDSLLTAQEQAQAQADGETFDFTLFVPQDPQRLADFVTLQTRQTGHPLEFGDGRVIVSEKLAKNLGVSVGDALTLSLESDGRTGTFTVGGIAENYVGNYVYVTPQTYADVLQGTPDYSIYLAKAADDSADARKALSTRLLEQDGVSGVRFTTDLRTSFADTMKSIDYIVVVLIISAGALAFVVLYNLTNINITERQRELATIKVLGFYDREVSAYIYRETAILTLIGTLVGLVFGIFLHQFVVKTAEIDMVMFGRRVSALSYLLSAGLTILFSVLVNLVMYRKLKKIDMVESMKSGE